MALNALTERHLAAPVNVITSYHARVLRHLLPHIKVEFDRLWAENGDNWRVGKGLAKLAKIDDSLIFDRVRGDRVTMMLKREIYPQHVGGAPPKKARAIQFTVNERTAYQFAPEAYAYSKALVHATAKPFVMDGVGFLVRYTACMSHCEIGEFADESESLRTEYVYSVIDERDGKNWDANVQVPMREEMVNIYTHCDVNLGEHTRTGINVRGSILLRKCGARIDYDVEGTVKSGHWDTSCGNASLNCDVSVQSILALPGDLRPTRVRALVMGDDYLAWLYFDHVVDPRKLMTALNDAERSYGIQPKRGLFHDIRNASFISLTFYLSVNRKVVPLPKVGRMFSKLFWTVTPLAGRDPRRLASGIAHAFMPLYSGWPPMRRFLKYHTQYPPLDVEDVATYLPFFEYGTNGYKVLPDPIDFEANHLVKYGFLSVCLEEDTFSGDQRAAICDNAIVARMYAIDMADPDERYGTLVDPPPV